MTGLFFNRFTLSVIAIACAFGVSQQSMADISTWNDWKFDCSHAPLTPQKPVKFKRLETGVYASDYRIIGMGTRDFKKGGHAYRAKLWMQSQTLCTNRSGTGCRIQLYHTFYLYSDLPAPAPGGNAEYDISIWKRNAEGRIYRVNVLGFSLSERYCGIHDCPKGFTAVGSMGRARVYPRLGEYHAVELGHVKRGRVWLDEMLLDDMESFPDAYRASCKAAK